MMRRNRALPFVVSLAMVGFGCSRESGSSQDELPRWETLSSPLERDLKPAPPDADRETLIRDQTQFGLDLYRRLDELVAGENLLISPYSLRSAFGMLFAGTVGDARAQMQDTLRFSLADDRQHVALNWLDLELRARQREAIGDEVDALVLETAHGIWLERTVVGKVKDAYLDRVAIHYGAELQLADFMNQAEAERVAINRWVELRTAGLVPELFPPGIINSFSVMVLVNALYLKAPWAVAFDPANTTKGEFIRLDDSPVEVDMMRSEALDARYAAGDDFTAAAVPLRGDELELIAVVPSTDFASFEAELDAAQLSDIFTALTDELVDLQLPKLDFGSDFDLTRTLRDQMPAPFADSRSFNGIAEGLGVITAVMHEATLAIDETGLEAAAATGIVIGDTGGEPPEATVEFRADRPFLVFVRDRPTGALLFFGRVLDPTA